MKYFIIFSFNYVLQGHMHNGKDVTITSIEYINKI